MKTFELIIENPEIDEVFAISMVANPAIEIHGTYFNKEEVRFAEMEEEGLFLAPILVPDKQILRVDGEGTPYSVFFSKETIKLLSQMYLERKYQDKITLEHNGSVEGITMVESWITESNTKDKSKLYNLNVPIGSWVGVFKIDNPEMREKFRNGEVSAVSIEGIFEHKLVQSSSDVDTFYENWSELLEKDVDELSEVEAEVVLKKIKAVITKDRRYKDNQRIDLESYSDYGQGVRSNARKAVEWAEKNGWGNCGTAVGKQRASQLAKGEPISLETIKRMYSYLNRHEGDLEKSTSFGDGCGYLMYQAWGGKSALSWSRNKLRELGELQENESLPSVVSSYPGEASGSIISPELLEEENLSVFGYETQNFEICPGAIGTFKHLTEEMDIQDDDLKDMIRAGAVIADGVFLIEKEVLQRESSSDRDLRRAEVLVSMFKDIFKTIAERTGMEHEISYMDGHIEVIKSYL